MASSLIPGVVLAQSLPTMPTATRNDAVVKPTHGLPVIPRATDSMAADVAESAPPKESATSEAPLAKPIAKADPIATDALDEELIIVQAEVECASEESQTQLLEELRLRLPEDIRVETTPSKTPGRTLDWSWQADSGCRLVLRDAQGLIELPLPPEPEAEQLRQAVVRVAWFISMNRESISPIVPVATATSEPVEINGLPNIPATQLKSKGLLAPPAGPLNTTAANAPLSDDERTRFESFKNSMSGIRDGSPNLFKKFRDFDEKPLTASFLGEPTVVGGSASISTDLTGINQGTAWLMSARAGVTFGERVGMGLVYKRLTSSVLHDPNWGNLENPPPDAFSGLGSIRLNLVGMDVEAVILRRDAWTWRASTGLHMGRMKSVSIDGPGKVTSILMLGEIDTQLYLAILPWLEGGVGLGARAPLLQGNDWVASPSDLRSGFMVMNLRVRLF